MTYKNLLIFHNLQEYTNIWLLIGIYNYFQEIVDIWLLSRILLIFDSLLQFEQNSLYSPTIWRLWKYPIWMISTSAICNQKQYYIRYKALFKCLYSFTLATWNVEQVTLHTESTDYLLCLSSLCTLLCILYTESPDYLLCLSSLCTLLCTLHTESPDYLLRLSSLCTLLCTLHTESTDYCPLQLNLGPTFWRITK